MNYEISDSLLIEASPRWIATFIHFLFLIQDTGTHFPLEMQNTKILSVPIKRLFLSLL